MSRRRNRSGRLLELERFLPYRLNVVAESVSRALSRLYAERYGIGVPEWRVMATLGEYERMTAKQVGAHSRMHKTKVSWAVTALEFKGLIEREPNEEDMREAFLALTGRGQRVYQDLAPRALAFERALDKTLGSGKRTHLDAILLTPGGARAGTGRRSRSRRPVMKLYTYFRSSAAYRVRIALNLKGIEAEHVPIHLTQDGGQQRMPAYLAKNPQALVPALELDDGTVLTQSVAIVEYLDQIKPEPRLIPADPMAAARGAGGRSRPSPATSIRSTTCEC